MVTAPVILLFYDRTFLAGSFKKALTKRAGFYIGLVLAWMFLGALLSSGRSVAGSVGVGERGMTSDALSYAATQLGVALHYLKLTVWPTPLILDNYWPIANTLNAILWPGLVVAAMAGLTLRGLIKNRPWAFIGLWFFIILSPSSSVMPIRDEYVNEYRMYLPVLAPIALLIMALYAALERALAKLHQGKTSSNQMTAISFAAVCAPIAFAFAVTTYVRNKDFVSPLSIWSDTVMKVPDNPRAHHISVLPCCIMAEHLRLLMSLKKL